MLLMEEMVEVEGREVCFGMRQRGLASELQVDD